MKGESSLRMQTGMDINVSSSKSTVAHNITIHKLVAEAFIEKPDGAECVNHIDGCKTNNRVSNLEWCTLAENNQHAFDTGLNEKSTKEHIDSMIAAHMAGLKKVVRDDGVVYASASEADRAIGASRGCVAKCIRGVMPTVKGHSFRWLDAEDSTEPEVLDADGVPIRKGDTVWRTDEINGKSRIVKDFCKDGSVVTDYEGTIPVCVNQKHLTHKQPDSLERIEADANKSLCDYWGCSGVSCLNCPAKTDGKKPRERYGTYRCNEAMTLDLLRRQREVLERDHER